MSFCPICSTELNLLNTPLLNKSRLANGDKLCKTCYDRLCSLYDPVQIHSLNPSDVKQVFANFDARVDDIITQIVNAGFDKQSLTANWNISELQYLPNELASDETIVAFANGAYMDEGGILVATPARLFFLCKPPLDNPQVTVFEWDMVNSIRPDTTPGYSALIITYSGDEHAIENVNPDDAERFCNNVSANISGFGPAEDDAPQADDTTTTTATTTVDAGMAEQDIPAQLEKYAALKEKGILTQEEFDAKKRQLLGL